MQHKNQNISIAIIGLGPKGLYALADLIKFLLNSKVENVSIYLFEKSGNFGTGPIYNPKQPKYLLMNYENEHINHSEKYVAEEKKLNYNQFANPKDKFSPRRQVGTYLYDLYHEIKNQVFGFVNIHEVKSEVINIKKLGEKFLLDIREGKLNDVEFDYVMVTTGHGTCKPSTLANKTCIDFVYPPEEKFKEISENEVVAIKGLGLTFIDAVLGLTAGRNGRFVKENGDLKYFKSGLEPHKIIPYSRSGSLMLPRINTMIPGDFNLKSYILKNISADGQLDFEDDLMPALEDEFALQGGKGSFVEAMEIDSFNIIELIDLAEGKLHPEILLASLIWRKFANDFNELYKNRGLSPSSQKAFDFHWKGKFQRLCYGPPLINFKKLKAVHEVGLLDLRFKFNPEINFTENTISNKSENFLERFDYHIDARIPNNKLTDQPSRLYQNMLDAGLIRMAKNDNYNIGCIDINEKGNPFNRNGEAIPRLTFYGIPTEGLTYNNDTLSPTHNNYATEWVSEIIKDLKNEYKQFDPDHSQVDKRINKSTQVTSILS